MQWWYITFLKHVLDAASYTAGKGSQIADVETETLRIEVMGITLTKRMLEKSCPHYPGIHLGTSKSTDPRMCWMVGSRGEERSPLKWSAVISASSKPSKISAHSSSGCQWGCAGRGCCSRMSFPWKIGSPCAAVTDAGPHPSTSIRCEFMSASLKQLDISNPPG